MSLSSFECGGIWRKPVVVIDVRMDDGVYYRPNPTAAHRGM
jgi:hypothetical protein